MVSQVSSEVDLKVESVIASILQLMMICAVFLLVCAAIKKLDHILGIILLIVYTHRIYRFILLISDILNGIIVIKSHINVLILFAISQLLIVCAISIFTLFFIGSIDNEIFIFVLLVVYMYKMMKINIFMISFWSVDAEDCYEIAINSLLYITPFIICFLFEYFENIFKKTKILSALFLIFVIY